MERFIYLDHAATTYVKAEVMEKMNNYFTKNFGNPSSQHLLGRVNRYAIEEAREMVARALQCPAREIFFTSSGSESNNWVLKGIAQANRNRGRHIITTSIEHHSILHTCAYLEAEGFNITYLPVDRQGLVKLDNLRESITDQTILISIMYANNEIGTIQPIEEIKKIAQQANIYFHTDAVQAAGSIPINLKKDGFDLLTLSAHKFYGPKGSAALYIKEGVEISPLIHGGSQENNQRAGTENVAGMIGLASALDLSLMHIDERNTRIQSLRDRLVEGILNNIPGSHLNGELSVRLPSNANISFEGVHSQALVGMLDRKGIAVSNGSACSCSSDAVSHVLQAIGLPDEMAKGTIRFSFGDENTLADVDYVLEALPGIVEQLRQLE